MTIQFGDTVAIEERRKQEARQEFNEALYTVFVNAEIPWAAVGYLCATIADGITADTETIQDWLDFQAGYRQYMTEQGQ